MTLPDRSNHIFPLRFALLAALVLTTGCGKKDAELQQTHAYMDSLRIYLGDLRLMDHEINKAIAGDSVSADLIVPMIAERLRPTVDDLRQRADGLHPTPAVRSAHTLLISYLDVRLQAYDAALRGQTEARTELFDLFSSKQIEAQMIGRDLEEESRRLLSQIPDYR